VKFEHYKETAVDCERICRLQTALREAKLDALVLRLPENIVMSFGVWPMNGFSYAVFTAEAGPVALIAPSCEDEEMDGCWAGAPRYFVWPRLEMEDPLTAIGRELREVTKRHKLARARIGYEGSFECVAPAHNAGEAMVPCESSIAWLKSLLPQAKWRDAAGLLHEQRAVKTPAEIARLRLAHQVAGYGLKKFMAAVVPGMTEAQVAAMVYGECLTKGVKLREARHVNVYPQISSGPNAHRAWRPVVTTGNRRLRSGEIALLELAVCVDGFWADVTRVKAVGRPTALQKEIFATVKAAQHAALKTIAPGVEARTPHEAATRVLIEAGFEKFMVHLTGHGVGFRYHEPEPFLMPGNTQPLLIGHVCSVEPGLYDPSFGGIRIEDNIAVTANGAEVLSKAPRRL
jgi:Xaa-Pro dipeptidase